MRYGGMRDVSPPSRRVEPSRARLLRAGLTRARAPALRFVTVLCKPQMRRLFDLPPVSSHAPGSKNVFGSSPSPARGNRLKRLYHFPCGTCGTSGSDASQPCNSSKSAIKIRPSRKRNARWSMIGPGGGFLIFGIPVLFVEYDPLQLVREAADFAFVFGVLQALQADMKGLFGSTEAGVGRRRFAGITRAAISALGPLQGGSRNSAFLGQVYRLHHADRRHVDWPARDGHGVESGRGAHGERRIVGEIPKRRVRIDNQAGFQTSSRGKLPHISRRVWEMSSSVIEMLRSFQSPRSGLRGSFAGVRDCRRSVKSSTSCCFSGGSMRTFSRIDRKSVV